MTARPLTPRQREIIEAYKANNNLRECGALLGISHQRVHECVKEHAPELMRPPHRPYDRSARESGAD